MTATAPFQSTHNLAFEIAPWVTTDFSRFRIGTCKGLWCLTRRTYDILAISNDQPGNGHLTDVFEWFENSCRRDGKSLRILDVINPAFGQHLMKKRGFERIKGTDNLIKHFR